MNIETNLLAEALLALNEIPNTSYKGKYKKTYTLAAEISKVLKAENQETDPYSSKKFKQLKFNYEDNG